jgi:DUF4097 and DUF4098 domain-containing protein YvlB
LFDQGNSLKRGLTTQTLLATVLFGTTLAAAQSNSKFYRQGNDWVQESTGTVSGSRIVRIKAHIGSITVGGASQSNITYTIRWRCNSSSEEQARRYFDSLKMTSSRSGDTTYLVTEAEGYGRRRVSGEFNVVVPRETEVVTAYTDAGNLQLQQLNAKIQAESGAGNIVLDGIDGSVYLQTGGGNVTVGTVTGDLKLETGAGNIRINSAGGKVVANSGGGNIYVQNASKDVVLETGAGVIRVDKVAGSLRASTGGSSIEVGDVGGNVELETGGGNIRLNGGNGFGKFQTGGGKIECYKVARGLHAETGAGSIIAQIMAEKGQLLNSQLETGAGDLIVYIPSDLAVTIRAAIDSAMGNAIRSDFAALKISSEGGEYGPREMYAEGNLNGGGPVLKLHTSTGKIQVLQLKK